MASIGRPPCGAPGFVTVDGVAVMLPTAAPLDVSATVGVAVLGVSNGDCEGTTVVIMASLGTI